MGFSHAQSQTNKSVKVLMPGTITYQLDSNYALYSKSIHLTTDDGQISRSGYTFNPGNGVLQFDSAITDTLILTYRKLPDLFIKPFYKKPMTMIEPSMPKDPFAIDPARDGYFNAADNSLKTDGNISRGISAGNKQDLVVNSNLNLRLSGKIADDIAITGVISDDNNPIQPEGNTQQLQDFDKVFIMLEKDSNALIIGDFEMKSPSGYFMKYYKKSRGMHVDYKKELGGAKIYSNADVAISRGRFARNLIQGSEGNQGPYRLSGNNGETFIIIISGTEVVYLDGRRLSRGESRDYVINYNSGEVTFTPNQMINGFSRIVVEFQYSDRNYSRSILKTRVGMQRKNMNVELNYFTEQDNKNQPFQIKSSLEGFDSTRMLTGKQILADAGDNVNNAYISRSRTVKPYDNSKLLYRKIDSLGFKDIYVFTQNPESDTVFFELVYSLVGAGNGNYRQKNSTANGRVFEWVMPIGGQAQGDYEPVEVLVPPTRYQMVTLAIKQRFGNTETFTELVHTNTNINTFSNLDKRNDDGFGMVSGIKNVSKLRVKKDSLIMTNQFKTELVNQDFKYVERYRPVEFERQWNKQLKIPVANSFSLPEVLANYDFNIERTDKLRLNYRASVYYRSKAVNGLSNSVFAAVKIKKTRFQSSAEHMNNDVPLTAGVLKNAFSNYDGEVSHIFKIGKTGGGYHSEKSTFKSAGDSLLNGSYSYQSVRAYIESNDTSVLTYGLLAERRKDELPYWGVLNASTQVDEIKWRGGYTAKKGSRISINGSFRSLQYLDTLIVKGNPEKNALGRLEADFPIYKKAIKFNTFYQIGTGQEQKREITYFQVADGNGVYIWNDYDSNKVQSLNEFEIASDYDRRRANFIRTFLPVQGFTKSRNIQFNQTVNINAPALWSKKKGIKNLMTKFGALFVFRTDRRTTSNNAALYLNPLIYTVNDIQLLSSNSSIRGTLYINRNNPTWSADINKQSSQSKNLLVNGFETRENDDITLNNRINFSRNWGTVVQIIQGDRNYYSQILESRNYNYKFYSVEPQLQFTSSNNNIGAALIAKYYDARTDTLKNNNIETGVELRLSKAGKGSFTGNFKLVNIAFNGDAASPLGYELMRGLLPGKNYTWNVVYQQRISANIQMDLAYDGRKSENSPIIHIGRVLARYLF